MAGVPARIPCPYPNRTRRRLRFHASIRACDIIPLNDALFSAIVLTVIVTSKIIHGAWIVVVLIPTFVWLFSVIARHYHAVAEQLSLDALEPEAVASLSPHDIERLQLEPGQHVRVSTRRGSITLRVRLDREVAEGMVFIPFCYTEAAANLLTNPELDPFGKIPEFKFCAARVDPGS